MDSVNLHKTFRRISFAESLGKRTETSELEKSHLYLFPLTLQFLDFIHLIVFFNVSLRDSKTIEMYLCHHIKLIGEKCCVIS